MKATQSATFLFSLAVSALLMGCKPQPTLFEALRPSAKAHDESYAFVGIWETPAYRSTNYIYKITDDKRWGRYLY